jgi:hypothetical protein
LHRVDVQEELVNLHQLGQREADVAARNSYAREQRRREIAAGKIQATIRGRQQFIRYNHIREVLRLRKRFVLETEAAVSVQRWYRQLRSSRAIVRRRQLLLKRYSLSPGHVVPFGHIAAVAIQSWYRGHLAKERRRVFSRQHTLFVLRGDASEDDIPPSWCREKVAFDAIKEVLGDESLSALASSIVPQQASLVHPMRLSYSARKIQQQVRRARAFRVFQERWTERIIQEAMQRADAAREAINEGECYDL